MIRHRVEFIFFQLVKWCVLVLPLRSAQRLGTTIGSVCFHLLSSRRRIAIDNLRHAFPDRSEDELRRIAKGAFQNYGITLIELLWFPNLTDEVLRKLITIKNMEVMIQGYVRGKGMVMLSGHFGNWELIAFGVAYLSKLPFTIIIQKQENTLVDGAVNRHRCLLGNKVVPMGMSVREILKTLAAGNIVAIAPDQSGPMEGVFVDFFGRSVATHQGPAAFALRTGAPLQMGFMIRKEDGTYEVILEEIESSDLNGYSDANVLELTRRHTALLEKYIRMYPDHWLWMHRRWKHTWESVQREKQMLDTACA
jgi:KDO2-lipid IV(A) lauroyltransferase